MSTEAQSRSLFDAGIVAPAALDAAPQARSARADAQPGHLRHRGRRRRWSRVSSCATLLAHNGQAAFSGQIAAWLWFTVLFANFAEAVAEGRGKAQAGRPAPHPQRYARQTLYRLRESRGARRGRQRARSARRRHRARRGRRDHPRRRRDHRGRRLGQRIGDHRRIRAGHPRSGRRPLGRDRRNDGALRLHQGADHRRAGLDLHRPDDRAGRGRGAAEDAERTGAVDPACRASR